VANPVALPYAEIKHVREKVTERPGAAQGGIVSTANGTAPLELLAFGDRIHTPRWLMWREEQRKGKPTKVPYDPHTGELASSTDPTTWSTCAEASEAAHRYRMDGVGYVLGDGMGGVDLDGCRNPDTGEVASWALKIVRAFRSYTEVSPSSTGLKIFAAGAPDTLPRCTVAMKGARIGGKEPKVEVFTTGRYFTVTGEIFDGVPDEIRDCSEPGDAWDRMVRWLAKKAGSTSRNGNGARPRQTGTATGATTLSAPLLQALARGKLARLWEHGEHGGTDRSRSGCDAALAALLGTHGFEDPAVEAALKVFPHGQVSGTGDVRQLERLLGIAADARARRETPASWPAVPHLPGAPDPVAYPLDKLPPALRDYVASVAAATQTPPDLALLLALACVSAAVGGVVDVLVDERGWRELPVVYVAVVLPPASRKSPVYALLTAPLTDWEREQREELGSAFRLSRDDIDVATAKLQATKQAKAKGKATREELENARRELDAAEAAAVVLPRVVASDATPEELVRLMAEQRGRLALMGPEADVLRIADGRYSDSARLDELCRAHAGEPITVDRIGREPIHIERAALTLGITLQPAVLADLRNAKAFRGQGLFGRITWGLPAHGLGTRRTGRNVPALDTEAGKAYARVVRALLNAAHGEGVASRTMELSGDALALLYDFEAEVEAELADGARLAGIRDSAGKAVGQAVRLATLLEVAARAEDGRPLWSDPIGGWAMHGGIQLARAAITHALAVLTGAGMDRRTEDAAYVLRRARDLGDDRSLRDLHDATRARPGLDTMDSLRPVVDDLVERGCVRLVERQSTGGRPPSPLIELHPTFKDDTPNRHPQNTQKVSHGANSGTSAGFAGAYPGGDACEGCGERPPIAGLRECHSCAAR
jgi:replicative DNA helicase